MLLKTLITHLVTDSGSANVLTIPPNHAQVIHEDLPSHGNNSTSLYNFSTEDLMTTSNQLYRDSLVIDGLNVSNWDSSGVYDSLQSGGVSAINATIATWENFSETLDAIKCWGPRFDRHGKLIVPVRTVDDILMAKREGKTGIILGFQNASPIENDLDRLAIFHSLGVRAIQVTYHERNIL